MSLLEKEMEEGRYEVSKIREAGCVKLAMQDSERCNVAMIR